MTAHRGRSILVIDSGVGGLSICQSILALECSLQLIYFADDAYFPYGLMDEKKLSERLHEIVAVMLEHHQPDLVVLACNTVSTLVLPELRAVFDIPFVGVVPAIKPAALLSKTKRIGLLATPATIKRAYTEQLISDYASDCEVLKAGSCELVLEAENLLSGAEVSDTLISNILDVFRDDEQQILVDTVVLGCTHFPLLKQYLNRALPGVAWVDSGAAIAKRVQSLLNEQGITGNQTAGASEGVVHQFYFSSVKPDEQVFALALSRLNIDLHQVHCFSAKMA